MGLGHGATILGTLLEVLGFYLVALELSRVEKREFGIPPPHARVWTWIRTLGRRRDTSINVPLASVVVTSDSVRARLTKGAAPDATVKERVTVLEENLRGLESEFNHRDSEVRAALNKIDRRVDNVHAQVTHQQQKREIERKEALKESVRLQWRGTFCFLIGAILAGLGSL